MFRLDERLPNLQLSACKLSRLVAAGLFRILAEFVTEKGWFWQKLYGHVSEEEYASGSKGFAFYAKVLIVLHF